MSKDSEFLAYTGGFFDADGSVGIYRSNKHYLNLRAVIIQKLWMPIFDKWQNRWGGNIYKINCGGRRWSWETNSAEATDFLRDILPYLRKKKPQARVAITYRENRDDLTNQQRYQYADALKELKRQADGQPPEFSEPPSEQLKLF